MDHDMISDIKGDNLMAQGTFVFIRHLRPNLDLGGGLSINTMLGYPMAFPSFYFRWNLKRYNLNVNFGEGIKVTAGVKLNDHIKLNLMGDRGGMMALTQNDGKKVYFTQSYANAGIQPEFTFGKLSIPVTFGITPFRNSYYKERTLKGFFENKWEDYSYPHFKSAFYISAGLMYQF